jgi:hypothetical protein
MLTEIPKIAIIVTAIRNSIIVGVSRGVTTL